jgi:hypothetical protein
MDNVGPPKKRFSRRSVAFSEYQQKQTSKFGGRAIPPDEHLMVLEDYLSIALRRRSDAFPMFKLQVALVTDLVQMEQAVSDCKQKVEELKGAANAAEHVNDIDGLTADIQMYISIRRALRDISDGIAWRLLDYDRAALNVLANYPRKPHINIPGAVPELYVLGQVFNEVGTLAVLNDLTHYLKRADVTVRRDASHYEFIEVKSSNTKSSTLTRQRADLTQTLRFLSEGQGEFDGAPISIKSLTVTPSSSLHIVSQLVREAQRTGVACRIISKYLAVAVIDYPKVFDLELQKAPKLDRMKATVERWRKAGDLVLPYDSTDRYHFVCNYAPFSVYRLTPLQRVKLMTGAMIWRAWLNLSEVLRYIQSKGWTLIHGPHFHLAEAAKTEDDPADHPFATFGKDHLIVGLSPKWVGRIGYEFLSPQTIIDAFEALLRAPPITTASALINFDGEAKQWD